MSGENVSRYDISTGALVNFTGLTNLNLSNTGITEIGGLVGLGNLVTLDVSNNQIADTTDSVALGVLAGKTTLTTLDISGNVGIKNISPLVALADGALDDLNVTGTAVVSENGDAVDTTTTPGETKGWLDAIKVKITTLTGYSAE